MKRGKFILSTMGLFPLLVFAGEKNRNGLQPGSSFIVKAGEARNGGHYKMKGVTMNVLDIKISSKDTEGKLAVLEQNGFTPNGGPPLHIHPFQDEYFYIIHGEYLFRVGEEKYLMKPGDTIFLPRNIPHAFVQLTEQGKVIVSYMPAGKMEDFFRTTDSWKIPPDQAEILKVFEDHEMIIVGPPLKAG